MDEESEAVKNETDLWQVYENFPFQMLLGRTYISSTFYFDDDDDDDDDYDDEYYDDDDDDDGPVKSLEELLPQKQRDENDDYEDDEDYEEYYEGEDCDDCDDEDDDDEFISQGFSLFHFLK
jgi:hypothetical protein